LVTPVIRSAHTPESGGNERKRCHGDRFRADVVVTQDRDGLWHWDGSYRIVSSGDDD
jgi:hypothetical protein